MPATWQGVGEGTPRGGADTLTYCSCPLLLRWISLQWPGRFPLKRRAKNVEHKAACYENKNIHSTEKRQYQPYTLVKDVWGTVVRLLPPWLLWRVPQGLTTETAGHRWPLVKNLDLDFAPKKTQRSRIFIWQSGTNVPKQIKKSGQYLQNFQSSPIMFKSAMVGFGDVWISLWIEKCVLTVVASRPSFGQLYRHLLQAVPFRLFL